MYENSPENPDLELVAQYRDNASLRDRVIETYYKTAIRQVRRFTDDLVGETLLALVEAVADLDFSDPTRCVVRHVQRAIRNYLSQLPIVHKPARSYSRKPEKWNRVDLRLFTIEDPPILDIAVTEVESQILDWRLNGYKFCEIAAKLGVSKGRVSQLVAPMRRRAI